MEQLPQVDRVEARRVLGIPVDGRYVATVGGMDLRKGIDLLAGGIYAGTAERADDRLLLVGKMSQPMRDLHCPRLSVAGHRVPDDLSSSTAM